MNMLNTCIFVNEWSKVIYFCKAIARKEKCKQEEKPHTEKNHIAAVLTAAVVSSGWVLV